MIRTPVLIIKSADTSSQANEMIYRALFVVCVSIFPYWYNLDGDFVFDDTEAITTNPDVISKSWTDVFFKDFWGMDIKSNFSHKSYRPLTILTFKINYYLNSNQLSARIFKQTNLILHTVCTLTLWQVFNKILCDVGFRTSRHWYKDIAYLATILFAVHPVHVENVSGIVGRADILAAISFLLSFLFYTKSMAGSKLSLVCAILLAGAAMLFKENGITALGFCLSYELIQLNRQHSKQNVSNKKVKLKPLNESTKVDLHTKFRILCTLVATLGLLYGRWMIMGNSKPEFKVIDNPAAFSNSSFSKVATYNYIYFLNLLLFIWPQWLCYDWSMGCVPLIQTLQDYRICFILIMYVYGILLTYVIYKNKGPKIRLIMLSLALGVVPFMPATNILFVVGFVLAERVLYISSAGYCLLITLGYRILLKKEKHKKYKISKILYCILVATYCLRSWQRAGEWRDERRLFMSGLSVCPYNAKVHYNVAKVVDEKLHNTTWAIEEYKEAISLHPTYHQAMNNLGNLLKAEERYSEAEYYLMKALEIQGDFAAAWMNLGIVLANTNKHEESELAYRKALHFRKNYTDCFYNLGNLYLHMNKTEQALENWMRAIELNSTFYLPWVNMFALLDNTNQQARAMQYIPKALQYVPESAPVLFAIGGIYGQSKLYAQAERHIKKAIQLFGENVQALHYGNLGVLYHHWKKYHLAEDMYRKAIAIDPAYDYAKTNLQKLQKYLKKKD